MDKFMVLMEFKGENVINIVDEHGDTALHIAVEFLDTCLPFVKLLLQGGISIDKENKYHYTALMLAVLYHTPPSSDTSRQLYSDLIYTLDEYGASVDNIDRLGYHSLTNPVVECYCSLNCIHKMT